MASKITVLCPNGKRESVKVTPNTNILKVLEEACKKQGLKPEDYDICHYNKPLDISLSVRYANLPNNAVLELGPTKHLRCEGTITVAVQLESGERVTSEFLPSSSLMEILNTCMSSRATADVDNCVPVFIYLQQKFTRDQMESTTLRNLGLTSGNASIRLMFRPIDSLDEQAHVSAPLSRPVAITNPTLENENICQKKPSSTDFYLEESAKKQPRLDNPFVDEQLPFKEAICAPSVQEDSSEETMQCEMNTASIQSNEDIQNMDEEMEQPVKEIGNIYYLGSRNAVLFNLQDVLEIKKEDVSDEFFELTINDVRYLMQELKKTRTELENMPLLTRSWREKQLLQELQIYRQTVIRIYFPDQLVLQGTFIADETVQSIIDFVLSFLEKQDLQIYLYTTPPKVILSPETTLLKARLVPASVVYFGCETPLTNYLRSDVRNQISDPRAASHAAAQYRKKYICGESSSNTQVDMDTTEDSPSQRTMTLTVNNTNTVRPSSSSDQVPAWFKLGKK